MKTRLHTYKFDISDPKQKAKYLELKTELEKTRKCFEVWDMGPEPWDSKKKITSGEYELETEFLFNNQWNGTVFRLHDWFQGVYENKTLKKGYWLEITPEMIAIRKDTVKCGYCGQQYKADERVFCDTCLDSEYLKEEHLHLLRLLPICNDHRKRAELTEAEKAELLPCYVERQTTGADSRNANKLKKQREDIHHKYKTETTHATTERDGFLWLMDNNVNIDNVIYYSTGRFCFEWRSPIGPLVLSVLLDTLTEFPFDYDIKKGGAA